MSDEDLIFLMRKGSKQAEMVFYARYSELSKIAAKDYFREFFDSGISEEDFYAVIFSKTYQAFKKYRNVKKSFQSYWIAVTKNAVYDYVRMNSYQLGAKSMGDISLDEVPYEDNEGLSFHDIIGELDESPIMETLKQYVNSNNHYFTEEEKDLIRLLFFENNSVKDLTDEYDITRDRVYYILKSLKYKIPRILKTIIHK